MRNQSQDDAVLEWLCEYGSIEPMQSLGKLGCYRLSAVIHRLRKKGHKITTSTITKQGRFGLIKFGKYTLNKQ